MESGLDWSAYVNREAQARQSECSPGCRLEWIEASMGLFHFMMAILGQIFKNFYGERADAWSLTRCMEALGRNPAKLWNQTNQQVKDFNMCKDFFDIVLDGCLVAMISFYFAPDSTTLANLEHHLQVASSDAKVLETMSGKLTSVFTDFHGISRLSDHLGPRSNDKASSARKRTFQNLALFVQHGMMFRTLDQAIREGDSGRISMCISYFVVWFQGTNNHNYARETMRLTACLKHIWSDELKQFWKQNCVVNLSGKAGGFVALDSVNEYLVREIKAMMGQSVTPETNERLRNVLSLLVFDFKDIKRTIADEADAEIFDFHSTPPSPWHDIRRIAPLILEGRLLASGGSEDSQLEAGDAEDRLESPPLDSYKALDLFAKGSAELGTTKAIRKLKDGIGKGDILYGLDEDEEINQLQEGEQA